jgi:hypothetical protein
MANTLKIKRSSVEGKIPAVEDLQLGELAINTYDGKLFLKKNNSFVEYITEIGGNVGFDVKNQTGSTITKGTLVGFAGTVGNSGKLLCAPFLANGTQPSEYFMGVVENDIPDGGDGFVIDHGKIYQINTAAYTASTILYASSTTAGAFTSTLPQAPNNKITVAAVINSHENNGVLEIRVTLGSKLANDESVELTSLTNNDIIAYNSSNSRFQNTALKTINSQSLLGSGNITISGGGGVQPWVVKTANYTLSAFERIIADSSGGSFTVSLPASPSVGDVVTIADGDNWANNPVTVSRNGSTIEGDSTDLILNISSIQVEFIYSGSTWEVYAFTGPAPLPWFYKDSNFTLEVNQRVIADTTGGTFTLSLPPNPVEGDSVIIADGGDWGQTPVTVAPNGSTIEGSTNSVSLNIRSIQVEFVYNGSTWKIYAFTGPVELPDQTGQSGKFLTTNGTATSWVNVPPPNNGTLTLATSGTGLSGSATFTADQSGNSTFTVSSNATNANTASTIVARDASGNFSAGTITANISGTTTNATNVAITNDTTSTTTHYLYMGTGTSGNNPTKVSNSKLTFQPSTGNLIVAGDVTSSSDIRLKTNILQITNALSKVDSIRGVSFDMDGKRRTGVIAQEVEQVLPEVIGKDSQEYLTVSYGNLAGLFIEAIKELNAEVKQLKEKLNELK